MSNEDLLFWYGTSFWREQLDAPCHTALHWDRSGLVVGADLAQVAEVVAQVHSAYMMSSMYFELVVVGVD